MFCFIASEAYTDQLRKGCALVNTFRPSKCQHQQLLSPKLYNIATGIWYILVCQAIYGYNIAWFIPIIQSLKSTWKNKRCTQEHADIKPELLGSFLGCKPVVNNKYISIASDQKNSLFYLQGYPKVLFVMFALIRSVVFFFFLLKNIYYTQVKLLDCVTYRAQTHDVIWLEKSLDLDRR